MGLLWGWENGGSDGISMCCNGLGERETSGNYHGTQEAGRTGEQLGLLWNIRGWESGIPTGIAIGHKEMGEKRPAGLIMALSGCDNGRQT